MPSLSPLNAAKLAWFWTVARTCGPARELTRVRAFLESVCGATNLQGVDPHQRPPHGYFPGLTAKAWHDPMDYPWLERLPAAYDMIREEADRIASQQLYSPQISSLAQGEWNVLHLHVMGKPTGAGRLLCPRTAQMTSELPGCGEGGMVFFSGLAGGTHVQAHCGASNTRLRCHLGLKVPPGCTIRVGDEERTWEERGLLVFDDSFDHEVWNRSKDKRWVLILDFWHPELTPVECRALARISYFRGKERSLRSRTIRIANDAERMAKRRDRQSSARSVGPQIDG